MNSRLRAWMTFAAGVLAGVTIVLVVLVVRDRTRASRDVYGDAMSVACYSVREHAQKASKALSEPNARVEFASMLRGGRDQIFYPMIQVYGDSWFAQYCGAHTTTGDPDLTSYDDTKRYVDQLLATVPDYGDGHYPEPWWSK